MMFVLIRRAISRVVRDPTEGLRVALLCLVVFSFGTTGFLYFELAENPQLTWEDAAWYTVVTVTTVGYGDLYPVTSGGRYLVALPLMFLGIGLLGYVLSIAASALVQAKQRELHGMGDFDFRDHLVLFNFSDVDKVTRVIDELLADSAFAARRREIVLVDDSLEELPLELVTRRVHYVRGAPTRDNTLTRCAVDNAAYAMVLSKKPGDPSSDALNVTITLAVEARAPQVITIVECVDGSVEELLRKAGCDRIACTARLDAHFLSQELLDPGTGDVISQLTSNLSGQQVYITELAKSGNTYAQVQAACLKRGHLSIGVRGDSEVMLNPSASYQIQSGQFVVTIGPTREDSFGV